MMHMNFNLAVIFSILPSFMHYDTGEFMTRKKNKVASAAVKNEKNARKSEEAEQKENVHEFQCEHCKKYTIGTKLKKSINEAFNAIEKNDHLQQAETLRETHPHFAALLVFCSIETHIKLLDVYYQDNDRKQWQSNTRSSLKIRHNKRVSDLKGFNKDDWEFVFNKSKKPNSLIAIRHKVAHLGNTYEKGSIDDFIDKGLCVLKLLKRALPDSTKYFQTLFSDKVPIKKNQVKTKNTHN